MRFPKEGTWAWKVLYIVAIILKPFFLRLQIEGEEHIPANGGCVVACNHTRGPDYVIVGYASPRQIYFMAKAEIFAYHPLLAKLVASAGAFPVHRGRGDMHAIEQAVEVVRAGHVLGMFPEGTRSRTGGLQRGKLGVARIALGAQAPIVPVVVIGSEPVLHDVLKLKRRPLVVVRFGPPVEAVGSATNSQDIQWLTTRMMLAMAELLPPERRGYYADAAALPAEDAWASEA
jgi:1-acyl-sn-glycerol-3-phosphate acyltransferase